MIFRLTPKTAELIGESPAEWQLLEKRALAAELGVAVREDGVVGWTRQPRPPHGPS
jgi:hypothetical protein